MAEIIKSNGERETFDPEKLKRSIQRAVVTSGIELADAGGLVEGVSNEALALAEQRNVIESKEIRRRVLEELDKRKPVVSRAWRAFDRKYKDREE